jgi:hypothetical protein
LHNLVAAGRFDENGRTGVNFVTGKGEIALKREHHEQFGRSSKCEPLEITTLLANSATANKAAVSVPGMLEEVRSANKDGR